MYYCSSAKNEFFCASNDLRALFANDQIPFQINEEACLSYPTNAVALGENEFSNETFFNDIYKLAGGSYLCWDLKQKQLTQKFYWGKNQLLKQLDSTEHFQLEELRSMVAESVSLRLDKKTIVDVSGGIDSANILAGAIAKGVNNVLAVNLSFNEEDMVFSHDKELVKKLLNDLNVKGCIISGENTLRIPNAELGRDPMYHIDGPDPRANPLSIEMFQAIGNELGIERALTGDGADYLFGTTMIYDTLLQKRKFSEIKGLLRKQCNNQTLSLIIKTIFLLLSAWIRPLKDYMYYQFVWAKDEISPLNYFTSEHQAREKRLNRKLRNQIQSSKEFNSWGIRYIHDLLYPRARYLDTSCVNLQYMHPFYDKSLMELVFRIPPDAHFDPTVALEHGEYAGSKQLLRKLFSDILPSYLLGRTVKTSYAHMARKKLVCEKENLFTLFSPEEQIITSQLGIIDKNKFRNHLIATIIQAHDLNNELGMNFQYLHAIIELEIWLREAKKGRNYILERSKPRPPRWLTEVEWIG